MSTEDRTRLAEQAERALKELLRERDELRKAAGLPEPDIIDLFETSAHIEPIRRAIREAGRG